MSATFPALHVVVSGMDAALPAAAAAGRDTRAPAFLAALGGAGNLLYLEARSTRLRLNVGDSGAVQEATLLALGAMGVLRLGGGMVEVIVGVGAASLEQAIHAEAEAAATVPRAACEQAARPATPPAAGWARSLLSARDCLAVRGERFVAALGGPRNLRSVDACATRLRLQLVDDHLVRASELRALGALGTIQLAPGNLQVVLGPIADTVAEEIRGVWRVARA